MGARPLVVPPRFKLLRRIGEGGMGVVYEALDVERGVKVALKTVIQPNPDALARFKHEFRALQDIHHPNLVGLGELLGGGDDVFFTMELVEGVDLLRYVRGEGVQVPTKTLPTAVTEPPTTVDPPFERLLSSDRDTAVVPSGAVASRSGEIALGLDGPVAITAVADSHFDEGRLRDAFRQIALGLTALHDAKRVHRDVKPSNVRVTGDGRVVLLDFGLVFESGVPHGAADLAVVGTPAYMAPEQAGTTPVGPAADWYAVGVMLYQCLAGRVPFEGATLAVLMAKQYREPVPPSALVRNVPPDLDTLCMELLRFEPGSRPSGRDVLVRFDGAAPPPASASASQPGQRAPFVGRTTELDALEAALHHVARGGGPVTVALYGESGVGKSSLVRRFLDRFPGDPAYTTIKSDSGTLTTPDTDALVLTGRCYEREAVPYKAFDEVIDTLSRRLARLSRDEVAPLLPPNVEAVAQLFPALCRVPGISLGVAPVDADPHERRREAFQGLRTLFDRIDRTHTLVLSIDDLQWTDADSLSLLVELLRPPDAPRLLLVTTLRGDPVPATTGSDPPPPADPKAPAILASLPGDVRPIHVGRLSAGDARQLAARLLRRASPGLLPDAAAIADEAAGHPLFIDELVRHAALTLGAPSQALRLDDALWSRVQRLDPPVRRVLDIACVIGAPMAQEIVAQAAGLEMRDFARGVSLLRTSNLVRTSGARVTDAIAPYHDRVRETVLARLTPGERRERHERIASALEGSKAFDPEVLAVHWTGAGEKAKGSKYAVVAAEQAAQALAFARAARLYQRALDLAADGTAPHDDARRRLLRRRLGDALANTGQGTRAADQYEEAATGASPLEALDLRRRASEQLLRSGQIERGTAATRAVLAVVGLSLPRTTFGAIVLFVWYRFLLRLRGFRYTPRDEGDLAPSELTRIDVCWSVSFTLPYADVLRGAVFQSLYALLALRTGERLRVARAMATEVTYLGTLGPSKWARTERMIGRLRELTERIGHPYTTAVSLATSGIACCMNIRFAESIARLDAAIEIFRERCPGSAWEVTTAQFFLFVAMSYACRFRELRERHEGALKDAIERGDHYGAVMLRIGVLNRIWWLGGDPARARRELAAAAETWPDVTVGIVREGNEAEAQRHRLHIVHFHHIIAECYVDLFEGNWERAHRHALANEPGLRRALLLTVEAVRLEWLGVKVRVGLAAAAAMKDDRAAEREELLRTLEHLLKEYGSPDHRIYRSTILSAQASIAASRGQFDVGRGILERILAELGGEEEAWAVRVCARWVLGRMRGGAEGEKQVLAAEAELAERGIAPDRRVIFVLYPGFASRV
ncbi:MAG TPA: AAA family ATPase [Polyangiaceae bacterium]